MAHDEDVPESSSKAKLKVTALLSGLGGVAGAIAGMVLTYLGNMISGYSIPPSFEIYLNNAGIIAVVGAVLAPPLAWSMLRAVPLWRAALETAAAGVVTGVLSMLFAPSFFVVAVPAGIAAAAIRLGVTYENQSDEPVSGAQRQVSLPGSHTEEG